MCPRPKNSGRCSVGYLRQKGSISMSNSNKLPVGHANIAITLDTYSHVIPGMGDATARAMEDALEGDQPGVQDAEDA